MPPDGNTSAGLANAAETYLDQAFTARGLGVWRRLYLEFLQPEPGRSILEVGAGAPDFLLQVPAERKVALDIGDRFRRAFEDAGIVFTVRDVETSDLRDLGPFDVVVCSDVFEHLLRPDQALARIADAMKPDGILFAHVPNEFELGHVLRVMMGRSTALRFHADQDEWNDPHLRRFTPIGFERFLRLRFAHVLPIDDLRDKRWAARLRRITGRVPYALGMGPTFIATNDRASFERMRLRKDALSSAKR